MTQNLLAILLSIVAMHSSLVFAAETIFENVTASTGLTGGGFVAWVDYDRDGHVDVVQGGQLFRNQGDGSFQAVASFAAGGSGEWADFDNDGHLDFYGVGDEGTLHR